MIPHAVLKIIKARTRHAISFELTASSYLMAISFSVSFNVGFKCNNENAKALAETVLSGRGKEVMTRGCFNTHEKKVNRNS